MRGPDLGTDRMYLPTQVLSGWISNRINTDKVAHLVSCCHPGPMLHEVEKSMGTAFRLAL